LQKKWILPEPDLHLVESIVQQHKISPLIAQVLINRGFVTTEGIEKFLQPSLAQLPDPFLLLDMDRAVERLILALQNKEQITIYGDYDVDGTTATALLVHFFQSLGARVDFYIPHRLHEGYSLNTGALQTLKARGTRVLITVDNGISAVHEAQVAKDLQIDLIITDHHEVPPQLPQATAILNPKRVGDPFGGKELAGVGVAFYLTVALRKALRDRGMLADVEPNLRLSLDLVAVGTIADMAPLTGINRILVREGLKVLERAPRPGLRALMEVAGVSDTVSSEQVAFRLGPRINAVGRLEDAATGVRLLLSDNSAEAAALAKVLNEANQARQTLEDDIVQAALAKVEQDRLCERYRSLVVFDAGWHSGVVGIVASRLVEKFHLPSIVLTRDAAGLKGSARSIRGLNLVETLRECSAHLIKYGGHHYAAGLSLHEAELDGFISSFDRLVRRELKAEDFFPAIKLDAESELNWINEKLLEEFARLEPFGLGNPEPLFLLRGVSVHESRVVGERHLRLKIGNSSGRLGAIGFRLAEKIPLLKSRVDLAFAPQWNEWNGSKNIQLRIADLRGVES
jgi:single-stranded-DNA-specific exonuclease RecJ